MAKAQSGLANYMAEQIFRGNLDYKSVVNKYPAYKDIIDEKLKQLNIIPTEDE